MTGASISVTVGGTEVVSLQGAASFSISPVNGFRLSTFKVDGFELFGVGLDAPSGYGAKPALPPTADLADPFNGKTLTASQLNSLGHIDVQFNDRSGTGIKESSILDAAPELEVLVNGAAPSGVTFLTPTRVSGNTYRYAFTGSFSGTGIVTVRFLPNSFSDNTSGSGTQNAGETEQFYIVTLNVQTGTAEPAGADRGARQPDERRVADRAGAQREALHRRHVPEPRRHHADQQAEHHRRDGRVHDHGRGRRRPHGRRDRPPGHRRRADSRLRNLGDRDDGHLPLLPEGQEHGERHRPVPARPGHDRVRHHVLLHRREPRRRGVHREQRQRRGPHAVVHAQRRSPRRRGRRRASSTSARCACRARPSASPTSASRTAWSSSRSRSALDRATLALGSAAAGGRRAA